MEENKIIEEEQVEASNVEETNCVENNEEDYSVTVENARLDLSKNYKKGRLRSNIMMLIVLVGIVGSMFLITRENATLKLVGWITVAVIVVGMIVFYALTKNILPKKTKEYIKIVNESLNGRNFSDGQFTDLVFDQNEKLELGDIASDGVYRATNIGSRNVVHGMFDKRSIIVGDLALYKNANSKNRQSAFVGKYVSYPNDLHFEGRIVLNFKREDEAYDQPDDIEDLKVVEETPTLVVYAKEGTDYKSILGTDFLNKFSEIKVEKYLLNICLVIWSGHSALYASYDDEVISLPFEKEFVKEANEQYRSNLINCLNALGMLKK